jgi:predicted metal-dependent phosphoesterase TrpH
MMMVIGGQMFENIQYQSIEKSVTASLLERNSFRHEDFQDCKGYETKFCSLEEAGVFMENGWGAADLHVHTWCSYDVLPLKELDPLALYKNARQKGFRFVTFTDHDTMNAYDRVGWTREGIAPGVEIKILDRKRVGHTLHINVYELNKKQFLELEEIAKRDQNLETFIDYLRDNNLPYVYNHPFWFEQYETPNLPPVFEIAELFPVIEYNMGRVNILNHQAMKLAERHNAGVIAGTDTHIGAIGRTFTLARGETFREFFNEVKAGRSYIMPQDMTVNRLIQEVNQRILNLFCKEEWLFDKPFYHINTGIKPVDDLVSRMAKAESHRYRRLRKIIRTVLRTVNRSRIPASLHIRSQIALGEKIKELTRESTSILAPELQAQWAH